MTGRFLIILIFILPIITIKSQSELFITQSNGLKVIVVNKEFPLLKMLLPGQPVTDRGIEVEFPEHVTGLNDQTNTVGHLYLVTYGKRNKRTLPVWHVEGNMLKYETTFDNSIKMMATARLEKDGLRYTYEFINPSKISYQKLQAVTCVKLYSLFSDTLMERIYVHHPDGFDLFASETPDRLTMGIQKWLPCRYLVSYEWPVNFKRIEKDEDGITRYNKSRKADRPFIATLSHDKKWIAATYTRQTGNLWTNPERSCQHADPAIDLNAGETKKLELKTFIIQDNLDGILRLVNMEMKK